MATRFASIWFRHLKTDWFCRRHPSLLKKAFVLASPEHGRLIIGSANAFAAEQGIHPGMAVADARALVPSLEVFDDDPLIQNKILNGLAEWCIRYTNIVSLDDPDGLNLDVTGCAHLWGGEKNYITDIYNRLTKIGYDVNISISGTVGAAWAFAHYRENLFISAPCEHQSALMPLPVSSLRLEDSLKDLLMKLGLRLIKNITGISRAQLVRRFGPQLIKRLDQAMGSEEEILSPVIPVEPYCERLPCLEPIVTAVGIEIALDRLLEMICERLQKENKGLRKAVFTGFRVDGKIEKIEIGTHRPSCNIKHLFKLFEIKISTIEPALGIDLFMIEALKTETLSSRQESIWETSRGLQADGLSELMDRLSNRFGDEYIHRYLPDEHYWPERSFRTAVSLQETSASPWIVERPRPIQILARPEPVQVAAPVPDYPPILFRYKGIVHHIKKADGPERIEREWWIEEGPHRDYYYVEDEAGGRYWIFRSGHYEESKLPEWFLHGFFA